MVCIVLGALAVIVPTMALANDEGANIGASLLTIVAMTMGSFVGGWLTADHIGTKVDSELYKVMVPAGISMLILASVPSIVVSAANDEFGTGMLAAAIFSVLLLVPLSVGAAALAGLLRSRRP